MPEEAARDLFQDRGTLDGFLTVTVAARLSFETIDIDHSFISARAVRRTPSPFAATLPPTEPPPQPRRKVAVHGVSP